MMSGVTFCMTTACARAPPRRSSKSGARLYFFMISSAGLLKYTVLEVSPRQTGQPIFFNCSSRYRALARIALACTLNPSSPVRFTFHQNLRAESAFREHVIVGTA